MPVRAKALEKLWGGVIPSKAGQTAPQMIDAAARPEVESTVRGGRESFYAFRNSPLWPRQTGIADRARNVLTETARSRTLFSPRLRLRKRRHVTNTSGEIQMLHKGAEVMGPRTDFDLLRICPTSWKKWGWEAFITRPCGRV